MISLAFGELIERIVRTRQFLKEARFVERPENVGLIDELIVWTENIQSDDALAIYQSLGRLLPSWLRHLVRKRSELDKLTSILGRIRGSWTQVETSLYLKDLFENCITKIETSPSIVLIPEYNFIHQDVYSVLGISEEKRDGESRSILGLPMIGYKAPNLWVILAHEMGHAIERECEIREKVKDDYNDAFVPKLREIILSRWIGEITADLIAARVLGPAYLSCFITFVLLDEDLLLPTFTHPSHKARYNMIKGKLDTLGCGISNQTYFFEKMEYRVDNFAQISPPRALLKIIRNRLKENGFDDIDPYELEKIFTPWFPTFKDLVEQVEQYLYEELGKNEINIPEFSQENLQRSVDIAKEYIKLNGELYIGSSRSLFSEDAFKKQFHSLQEKEQDSVEDVEANSRIYKLLNLFKEEPNKMSEIMNAVWEIKFHLHRKLDKCTRSYAEIKHLLDWYDKELSMFDNMMLKSIEVASIHRFYDNFGGLK